MRRPRLKAPAGLEVAYYHCVSRVVGRELVFGGEEKEMFVRLVRSYERLCGLRVVGYCVMSNHVHLLVEVPRPPAPAAWPDDAGLVSLVRESLGDRSANELQWQLGHWRGRGAVEAAERLRQQWFGRMWDVSRFMKVLKQRFSHWFNQRHGRRGTLWEDRFRSVLVEGKGNVLRSMAAYIDLNPVRAGICEDPKDYRWSNYGEAVAGGITARAAVMWLASLDPHGGVLPEDRRPADQVEALRRWRCWLFGVPENEAMQAEEAAKGDAAWLFRHRVARDQALEVLAKGGRLSRAEFLQCKVRFFTDGVVLGGREFVEEVFTAERGRFSQSRKNGARLVRGLELEKPPDRLYALRDLRKDVFG